jgi:hypothetical protein
MVPRSFTLVLDGPRVNEFGGGAGAVGAGVFRLQRLGNRCGCRLRLKTTLRHRSQLMPPSDFRVRLTFFTPGGRVWLTNSASLVAVSEGPTFYKLSFDVDRQSA